MVVHYQSIHNIVVERVLHSFLTNRQSPIQFYFIDFMPKRTFGSTICFIWMQEFHDGIIFTNIQSQKIIITDHYHYNFKEVMLCILFTNIQLQKIITIDHYNFKEVMLCILFTTIQPQKMITLHTTITITSRKWCCCTNANCSRWIHKILRHGKLNCIGILHSWQNVL